MDSFDVTKTIYKVSDFVSWQRAGSLVLSPSFQRRPVWKPGAKSYLIDTIVRGLPIPVIFLRDQRSNLSSFEPKREIVDGQQRLRTVIAFVQPTSLKDYNHERDSFFVKPVHNQEIAGLSFDSLPQEYQQRILDYEFSVHVLSAGVDDRDVLGLFARMNSTGVKLNDQELRNAEFFGEFKTSMYTIAATHLPRWRRWGIATENDIARMQEVELTSEFAVMMKNGLTAKRRAWINLEYLCFDDHYPDRSEIASRFHTVMDTIDDRLGSMVVSTFFRRRTLFFGLFVSIYDLQFGLNSPLEPRKPRPLSAESVRRITSAGERLRNKSAPLEVLQSVTRRTTNEIERTIVHQYIQSGVSDA